MMSENLKNKFSIMNDLPLPGRKDSFKADVKLCFSIKQPQWLVIWGVRLS